MKGNPSKWRKSWVNIRVSQNAPKCLLASIEVHVAVSVPQEPQNKISWVLGHFWGVSGHIFCKYKGNSEKYKRKYAIRPFSLSFFVGRSNQHNSFARLLHFYSCFRRHPCWCHSTPYVYMAIWPYSQNMAISPYDHMTSKVADMGVPGNSNKNAAIWRRN